MTAEDKLIPSGSLPLDTEAGEEVQETEPTKTPIKVGDREFESPEVLAEAYANLEKKIGEHGTTIGKLKAREKDLAGKVAEYEKSKAAPAEESADLESQLMAIRDRVDRGDIDVSEALVLTAKVTNEMSRKNTLTEAEGRMQALLKERDATALQQKFLNEHPDFTELQQAGVLQEMIAKNPMHDEFSAYFELKAVESYQRGKDEMAHLKEGAEKTKPVLTKPGAGIRDTNPQKRLSAEGDLKDSMKEALARARAEDQG